MPDKLIPSATPLFRSALIFHVGAQRYGVFSSAIEQITPIAALDESPGMPKLLAGFLNLAGETVPVVRLGSLFGQADTPTHVWTPLIILRESDMRLALLVDEVLEVVRIDEKAISTLPPGRVLNDSVEGVVRLADKSVLLLSPERLLLQQELRVVTELQELAQNRLGGLEAATA